MSKQENFICRGITKENEFVYGYYIGNNFMITKENAILGNNPAHLGGNLTEIIQAPDIWTTKYDKNKNKIWENDKVHSNRKLMAYDSLKGESTIVYKNNTSSVLCFIMSLNKHYLESPLTDAKAKFLKVIGNTHKINP